MHLNNFELMQISKQDTRRAKFFLFFGKILSTSQMIAFRALRRGSLTDCISHRLAFWAMSHSSSAVLRSSLPCVQNGHALLVLL